MDPTFRLHPSALEPLMGKPALTPVQADTMLGYQVEHAANGEIYVLAGSRLFDHQGKAVKLGDVNPNFKVVNIHAPTHTRGGLGPPNLLTYVVDLRDEFLFTPAYAKVNQLSDAQIKLSYECRKHYPQLNEVNEFEEGQILRQPAEKGLAFVVRVVARIATPSELDENAWSKARNTMRAALRIAYAMLDLTRQPSRSADDQQRKVALADQVVVILRDMQSTRNHQIMTKKLNAILEGQKVLAGSSDNASDVLFMRQDQQPRDEDHDAEGSGKPDEEQLNRLDNTHMFWRADEDEKTWLRRMARATSSTTLRALIKLQQRQESLD